ncbi:MAG TPA: hypothetical protein VMV49_12415, partial [Candidatus Deferrimicrobium sp.]|nr:hypothetical protein [Candidatus Deferrimicrobium sp.]
DPLVALLVVGILIQGTYRVLKASIFALMQKSPIDTKQVTEWMTQPPKIIGIHDLHIWQLCSNVVVLTCHAVVESCDLTQICQLRGKLQEGLLKLFKIQHSTIQFELECDQCSCDLIHKEHHHSDDFTCPID